MEVSYWLDSNALYQSTKRRIDNETPNTVVTRDIRHNSCVKYPFFLFEAKVEKKI
jgi:hypothetical protein